MYNQCRVRILNEVDCVVSGLTDQDYTALWEQFGFYVDGFKYMPAYQLGRWDGKIRFFDKTGKTSTKLLDELIPKLLDLGYGDIDLRDDRIPIRLVTERAEPDRYFERSGKKIRPYQIEAVNELLDEGSGFVIAGTGAGKTIICATLSDILSSNGYKCLVIVPSSDLVTQTIEEFEELGLDVGEYSGDKKQVDSPIVVATWQALQYNKDLMSLFKAVIVDEAHGATAQVIGELINKYGSHIAYRFGVTGTFPKPVVDKYTLKSSIGRIVKVITSEWLIANGYLSTVNIDLIETQESADDFAEYASEKAYLARKEDRIEALAEFIKQKRDEHGNVLVLVGPIPFGRKLAKAIGEDVEFLYGESKKEIRKEFYDKFEHADGLIVIATFKIASTGISIDRIFSLISIDAGKSFIKAIQTIGRGLRRGRDKTHVAVYDIYSKLRFSKKHAKDRVKYYKEAKYPVSSPIKMKY